MWTSPTGHTYRVSPQALLDPTDSPDNNPGNSPDDDGEVSCGDGAGGELPAWVHRLLADVLPAWVGWPPDGRPAPDAGAGGDGTGGGGGAGEVLRWSTDWARAVLSDTPPEPAPASPEDDDGQEPYLFDDLPAA